MNLKMRLLIFFFPFCIINEMVYSQTLKLTADDRTEMASFGTAVSLNGNFAIIGANGANNSSTSIDNTGAAYIFQESENGNWNQVQKLLADDGSPEDFFGWSASIDGDTAIVGAFREDEDENNANTLDNSGAAYIYKQDSNTGVWEQVQKIVASDRSSSDGFGISVAISGDFAVIGAYFNETDSNGMNPMSFAGAAYIFKNTNGSWTEVQKIVASDREVSAGFGGAVDISQDKIIVSAPWKDFGSTEDVGAVYFFQKNSGDDNWLFDEKISASSMDETDFFGFSVALNEDYAVVGTGYEDFDENDENFLFNSGAAYVYRKEQNWVLEQKVTPDQRNFNSEFGRSVSIDNGKLLIGAVFDDYDENDENEIINAGSAYVFERNSEGEWLQIKKIVAHDREADDWFGGNVCIDQDVILISAHREDHDISGSNFIDRSGSIYVEDALLGIDDFVINNIELYPTIAKDYISITSQELLFGEYVVIDTKGVICIQNDFDSGSQQLKIDISELSEGLYILILKSANSTFAKKFIKN